MCVCVYACMCVYPPATQGGFCLLELQAVHLYAGAKVSEIPQAEAGAGTGSAALTPPPPPPQPTQCPIATVSAAAGLKLTLWRTARTNT